MLVPRTRLLAWVALIVIPFAVLAGILPETVHVAGGAIAVFVVVVILDAAFCRRLIAGLRVQVPELVRLQKDRAGTIGVRIENPDKTARHLRIGFAFPKEISTGDQDILALLPACAAVALIDWACVPLRRGQYWLERAYLETSSRLGFWSVRKSHAIHCELRVYPNLADERKSVAAIFLRRGSQGTHSMRQAGQGRDFEKLREYVHGDSVDDIHWKASAKRGFPVTKVFQVERTQEVYVIVDASRLTAREVILPPTGAPDSKERVSTVLERFVTSALILGQAAEQQGDQFGLITFSDKVHSFVRAKNGQAHYGTCRDRLYGLHPRQVSPDFDELCAFIRLKLRKRALLVFLTALDDPFLAEGFVKSVELVCRQHLVVVDMLKPPAADPLFTHIPETMDDLYSHLGGHLQWTQLRELQKVLQRRGVRLALMDPSKLSAGLVAQHADIKARQLV